MVEIPEIRELSVEEMEELRKSIKVFKESFIWYINEAQTIKKGEAELKVENPEELSFNVQSLMVLTAKIVLPSQKLDYYYQLKSTRQIIRMYHNKPGHCDIGGRIIEPHKHYFTERWIKRAYPVTDINDDRPVQALKDFCIEENIGPLSAIERFTIPTRLERWG